MSSPHLVKESSPLGLSLSGPVSELSTGVMLNSTRLSASRPQTSLVVLDKSQALTIHQTYDDYTPNRTNGAGVRISEHSSFGPHKITISTFFNKSKTAAFLAARGGALHGRVKFFIRGYRAAGCSHGGLRDPQAHRPYRLVLVVGRVAHLDHVSVGHWFFDIRGSHERNL